eukprot:8070123-Pyramimonas_sp.AAC.1
MPGKSHPGLGQEGDDAVPVPRMTMARHGDGGAVQVPSAKPRLGGGGANFHCSAAPKSDPSPEWPL